MVFEVFVKTDNEETRFPYPKELGSMTGSIFSESFDLNNLKPIKGGISAGSIGMDFYLDGIKRLSMAIQARSDKKTGMLDIDCFTRNYCSDGITELPNSVQSYPEAEFHNISRDDLQKGLTIKIKNSGSEISQSISKEDLDRLFVQD